MTKRELNAITKSIDLRQPAHFAQADLGRNFLQLVNFLYETFCYWLIFCIKRFAIGQFCALNVSLLVNFVHETFCYWSVLCMKRFAIGLFCA